MTIKIAFYLQEWKKAFVAYWRLWNILRYDNPYLIICKRLIVPKLIFLSQRSIVWVLSIKQFNINDWVKEGRKN